jgi:hypothetical protein
MENWSDSLLFKRAAESNGSMNNTQSMTVVLGVILGIAVVFV